MRIALYSEIGRQVVVAARRYIAEQGFPSTATGIRMCREAMTADGQIERFRHVISFTDFFSASECRDLMFHVQEHRFTLPMLEKTLASLDLQFLGWVAPQQVLDAYAQQFPADTAGTSLANWHLFETDYPETFASMYHFFVQPRATAAGRR